MSPPPALLAASSLSAQVASAPTRDNPALLADETFSEGGFDPVRVFLARDVIYLVEFSEPAVLLSMRSHEGKPLPFVVTVNLGPDVTGRTNYELRPQMDGVIEFKPEYVVSGKAVRFRIWSLGDGTYGGRTASDRPPARWVFGLMAERAHHGEYVNSLIRYGNAGSSTSICAAIQRGAGILEHVWGCVVGLDWETGGSEFRMKYLYAEPRIRLLERHVGARINFETGVAMRYGQRLVAPTKPDTLDRMGNALYSIGAYAGFQLPEGPKAGGPVWTVLATINAQHVQGRTDEANGAGTTVLRVTVGRFF